jgi:hypothetical protein
VYILCGYHIGDAAARAGFICSAVLDMGGEVERKRGLCENDQGCVF